MMSDSDSDCLFPNNFLGFPSESTIINARGPTVNRTIHTNSLMSKNTETQRFKENYDRNVFVRREISPMSVRSYIDRPMSNMHQSYIHQGFAQSSVMNSRATSPTPSILSIGSNAASEYIVTAFKSIKFNKHEMRNIEDAYFKYMKGQIRKRGEIGEIRRRFARRRNLKHFLKRAHRKSDDDSGEQGSDSSISSDDCRSTRTGMSMRRTFQPTASIGNYQQRYRVSDDTRSLRTDYKAITSKDKYNNDVSRLKQDFISKPLRSSSNTSLYNRNDLLNKVNKHTEYQFDKTDKVRSNNLELPLYKSDVRNRGTGSVCNYPQVDRMSDDIQSTKSDFILVKNNVKHDSIYKSFNQTSKQSSFRNILSLAPKNANTSIYNKTEGNTSKFNHKNKFQNSFPLPSQRFNKNNTVTTILEEPNEYVPVVRDTHKITSETHNSQKVQTIRPINQEENNSISDLSDDDIFNAFHVNKNSSNFQETQRKRILTNSNELTSASKRVKLSSPEHNKKQMPKTRKKELQQPINDKLKLNKKKECLNKSITLSNLDLSPVKNQRDFVFAKPQLPLRKSKSNLPTDSDVNLKENLSVHSTKPKNISVNQIEEHLDENDVSLRPSFIKRKLFTQNLDVTEAKNPSLESSPSMSPQNYNDIIKEKNKARKLVTNQSCLSRDILMEDNNLLDLIHKIVPPEHLSYTNNTLKNDTLLKSNVDESKTVCKESATNDKWDVTSIISTMNKEDVSDTFTDDEIFKSVNGDDNKSKNKSKVAEKSKRQTNIELEPTNTKELVTTSEQSKFKKQDIKVKDCKVLVSKVHNPSNKQQSEVITRSKKNGYKHVMGYSHPFWNSDSETEGTQALTNADVNINCGNKETRHKTVFDDPIWNSDSEIESHHETSKQSKTDTSIEISQNVKCKKIKENIAKKRNIETINPKKSLRSMNKENVALSDTPIRNIEPKHKRKINSTIRTLLEISESSNDNLTFFESIHNKLRKNDPKKDVQTRSKKPNNVIKSSKQNQEHNKNSVCETKNNKKEIGTRNLCIRSSEKTKRSDVEVKARKNIQTKNKELIKKNLIAKENDSLNVSQRGRLLKQTNFFSPQIKASKSAKTINKDGEKQRKNDTWQAKCDFKATSHKRYIKK